ncbi:MAG: hypothetical protein COV52_01805 [Gammaproteobacteria bacterium CG11_big_fil_rev_8_21_14_0_20_46_22]|nr:MAG: hypothetical protein COW05_05700 [Gammaproteobacteria bacterium CG12_big_fil_rev_8_21_14_0_65_46_12]PIR11849.1 MAG: hypothetical protein COV52_01805 [Gammaproteobacteria bacterium CG11_big_fil_rev_8_21_14_0_20_46_22]
MTTNNNEKFTFYTSEQLAELLDVDVEWVRYNRNRGKNPIPAKRFGYRTVVYDKKEVLEWFGRKDLTLKFYRTKKLAEKLGCSEAWLKANRASDNPIPFRRLGYLVRYNEAEVNSWVKNNTV